MSCEIESTGVYEVSMVWTDVDGNVLQSQKDEESRQKAELDAQLRAMQASTTDAGHRTAALEQQNAALNGKLARVLQELREIAGTLQSVPN